MSVEITRTEKINQLFQVYSLDTFRNASDILSEQNKMAGNTESILNTVKEYG
jgi:hypothetical protein